MAKANIFVGFTALPLVDHLHGTVYLQLCAQPTLYVSLEDTTEYIFV